MYCLFFFDLRILITSLWYLVAIVLSVFLRFTDSDYLPLVSSSNSCWLCISNYSCSLIICLFIYQWISYCYLWPFLRFKFCWSQFKFYFNCFNLSASELSMLSSKTSSLYVIGCLFSRIFFQIVILVCLTSSTNSTDTRIPDPPFSSFGPSRDYLEFECLWLNPLSIITQIHQDISI